MSRSLVPPSHRADEQARGVVVRPLAFQRDELLLAALHERDGAARNALFDRFAPRVRVILLRLLGTAADLDDSLHDVFFEIFKSVGAVRSAAALPTWITSVTINVAHKTIRSRRRKRWLTFVAPEELAETHHAEGCSDDDVEALRASYRVLTRLSVELRTVFILRFIEGMELTELAAARGTSLATIKRRLRQAGDEFSMMASREPALAPWVAGGRWKST